MSEPSPLSLAELEAYGRAWGTGRERRALCPFCGDDHKRDQAHASLAFNDDTGAWTCHRCSRSGLLTEYKDEHRDEPLRLHGRKRLRAKRRPLPTPADPPAEEPEKRDTLRRLWSPSVTIDAPEAAPGAAYLVGRGIPLAVASAARVRFARDWYGAPAVLFPVQDEDGRLVAAEGRYLSPTAKPKSRSAGRKSRGVFCALPGAAEAVGVTLCEGPITALSVAACGFPAVALCGHKGAPSWLVHRCALRPVFLAFDYGEAGAEEGHGKLARELAALGAAVYRLAPPAGAGDFNDRLRAVGLEALRAELDAAICGALVPVA